VQPAVGVEPGAEWTPPASKSEPASAPPRELPPVEVADVKAALYLTTSTMHLAAGERIGADLVMTNDEIDRIAPPLTSIINRNPKLRAMGATSDSLKLAFGMLMYSGRVGFEAYTSHVQAAQLAERAPEDNWGPDDA
jgi:hypothetical protein